MSVALPGRECEKPDPAWQAAAAQVAAGESAAGAHTNMAVAALNHAHLMRRTLSIGCFLVTLVSVKEAT